MRSRVAYDAAYAAGLAAERAKAERLIAEFVARDAQHVAELKAEQAQTEKAIAAFSAGGAARRAGCPERQAVVAAPGGLSHPGASIPR